MLKLNYRRILTPFAAYLQLPHVFRLIQKITDTRISEGKEFSYLFLLFEYNVYNYLRLAIYSHSTFQLSILP